MRTQVILNACSVIVIVQHVYQQQLIVLNAQVLSFLTITNAFQLVLMGNLACLMSAKIVSPLALLVQLPASALFA